MSPYAGRGLQPVVMGGSLRGVGRRRLRTHCKPTSPDPHAVAHLGRSNSIRQAATILRTCKSLRCGDGGGAELE